MLQDLRFGLRMLRRSPGFSLLAILCLTAGIGATTAVFSWIEGILLRPFPAVADQERLVVVAGTAPGTTGYQAASLPDFEDFRKSCTLLDSFIVEKIFGTTLSIGDRAERAAGSVVSANYFDVLGIHPILGRGFQPAEDFGRNAHPVTVISYLTWQDRYHADPQIIGRTQMLNGVRHTIIGVAPEGFQGTFVGYSFNFWVPTSMQELFEPGGYKLEDRGAHWIEGFARLKPGVTRAQAQAEIEAVAKRLAAAYPATNRGRGVKLLPLWRGPFNGAGTLLPTLTMSLAVVCLVLLIACANVGNLLLVRSFARRHEMTVRLSVGARRGRLLRQLLTEGLILSTVAAAGGVALAYWCRNAIMILFPPTPGITISLPAELDWRVMVLSAAVCVFSTLLFGVAPALETSRVDLAGALKCEATSVVGNRRRAWVRSGLVLVQVSLSFVLLVGAGMLLHSLYYIRTASPGFSTSVLATSVDVVSAGYDSARARNFHDALVERIGALPGVESVSFARVLPFSYRSYSSAPIAVVGYQTAPDDAPTVEYNEVGPAYFSTIGIPLLSGREFTRADNESAPLVAVVNEPMARQYWRGRDPVGASFQLKGRSIRVVGVAKLAKYRNFLEPAKPLFYVPSLQSVPTQGVLIRTRLAPAAIAKTVAREVHALDANLAPTKLITLRQQIDESTWTARVGVVLLTVFGGLALALAAIGLYGVMSYGVSQSKRELGLRMALGARAIDLLRMVVSQGLALTALGVVVGAVAALALTRLLGNLLYRVSPGDPLVFGSALAVMALAALAACLGPAWRATRTDPLRALRD